ARTPGWWSRRLCVRVGRVALEDDGTRGGRLGADDPEREADECPSPGADASQTGQVGHDHDAALAEHSGRVVDAGRVVPVLRVREIEPEQDDPTLDAPVDRGRLDVRRALDPALLSVSLAPVRAQEESVALPQLVADPLDEQLGRDREVLPGRGQVR